MFLRFFSYVDSVFLSLLGGIFLQVNEAIRAAEKAQNLGTIGFLVLVLILYIWKERDLMQRLDKVQKEQKEEREADKSRDKEIIMELTRKIPNAIN